MNGGGFQFDFGAESFKLISNSKHKSGPQICKDYGIDVQEEPTTVKMLMKKKLECIDDNDDDVNRPLFVSAEPQTSGDASESDANTDGQGRAQSRVVRLCCATRWRNDSWWMSGDVCCIRPRLTRSER